MRWPRGKLLESFCTHIHTTLECAIHFWPIIRTKRYGVQRMHGQNSNKTIEIPPFSMAFRCPKLFYPSPSIGLVANEWACSSTKNMWPNMGMIGMCAGSKCVASTFCYLLSLRQSLFLYSGCVSLSLGLLPYLLSPLSTAIYLFLWYRSIVLPALALVFVLIAIHSALIRFAINAHSICLR